MMRGFEMRKMELDERLENFHGLLRNPSAVCVYISSLCAHQRVIGSRMEEMDGGVELA
jgi:hypothetical protein